MFRGQSKCIRGFLSISWQTNSGCGILFQGINVMEKKSYKKAFEYPDVELTLMHVDNAAVQLIHGPKQVCPASSTYSRVTFCLLF
ncbi:hypothetical protein C5167_050307 [Papaver somniferum]|uniref:Uncharacterized protein n=1 Tax=Papaver somniferum TaxID=3469 RepID=A0A4Y7KPP3_PAPSO|nr:hypothetical protein C5167_050307 [Papaver somniferum]